MSKCLAITKLQTDNGQVDKCLCFTNIIESNAAIAALIILVLRTKVNCARIAINLDPVSAVNLILIVILQMCQTKLSMKKISFIVKFLPKP